jgi:type II secretory ATPase GspE/PulE/Tfp pilus assembly ATPase PilB-like protein
MSQDARRDEERSTERRAQILGLTYLDTSVLTDKPLFKDILTNEELYKYRVVPVQADRSNILFGVTTTTSQQTIDGIRRRFSDQRTAFNLISETGFRDYMRMYDPPQQVVYRDITAGGTGSPELTSQVSAMLQQVRADDMLAYLVSQAHRLGASDIHLEAQPNDARVRFRTDGVLHLIARLTPDKYRVLISAIASAGNVSTSANEAQQGHIAQRVTMADGAQVDLNLRLETVPTIHGMDVVMRLFNMDASKYTLDRLGLNPEQRAVLDDIIAKPSGLVLVVGPTGSGKTTTLYSILNSLNSEERKIITIEDPVEYQFEGITQISVRSAEGGDDARFADKLRATLRLDPDIVMVGEIRDNDTAKTALQASLTGHLVLSTYHAGSASEALTRLMDIIGQNPLFVSAIRLVMAQRLIRRLDDTTKQPYQPTLAELERLQAVINTLPEGIQRPDVKQLQLYRAGSSAENPYGFRGQIAIREQFRMAGSIRQLLEQHTAVLSSQSIEEAAIASGMRTMLQDAILHVCAGETTMEEVYRVVG